MSKSDFPDDIFLESRASRIKEALAAAGFPSSRIRVYPFPSGSGQREYPGVYGDLVNRKLDELIKSHRQVVAYMTTRLSTPDLPEDEQAALKALMPDVSALNGFLYNLHAPIVVHQRHYTDHDVADLKAHVDNVVDQHNPFKADNHALLLGSNIYEILIGVDGFLENMELVGDSHYIYDHGFMGRYRGIGILCEAYTSQPPTLKEYEAQLVYLPNGFDLDCDHYRS